MKESAIPYGVMDFKQMRLEGLYYVDKTAYIRELENDPRFVSFLRPRRFGKTLFCDMLRCYYDIAEKDNFGKLFGDLDIGKNPTEKANKYFVLSFDFSKVNNCAGETWEDRFKVYINEAMDAFVSSHMRWFENEPKVMAHYLKPGLGGKYFSIYRSARRQGIGIFVTIDGYDSITNEAIPAPGKNADMKTICGTGFYRAWLELIQEESERVFMTGVSPVTMEDLWGGLNLGMRLTCDVTYNGMAGFTDEETRKLFEEFHGCGKFTGEIKPHLDTVKAWYGGYCFSSDVEESVCNCGMVIHYLRNLVETGLAPENPIDRDACIDWTKLKAMSAFQCRAEKVEKVLPFAEKLAEKGEIPFELMEAFPFERAGDVYNFESLCHYYGIVTMGRVERGDMYFRVPNECVQKQIFEYMRSEYAKHPNAVDGSEFSKLFKGLAWDGEWEPFFRYLAEKYFENGSVRDGIGGEARINGYLRAYLTMESGYIVKPEMSHPLGFSDYAMFPDRMLPEAYVPVHSYIIEVKHSKAGAKKAELDAKHREALEQLAKYAADPRVEKYAAGGPVHYLVYEFKGRKMVRLEEVSTAELAKMAEEEEK